MTISQWVEKLSDGSTVIIRPIRPDDIDLEREFIEGLSPQTRHFRFFEGMRTPSPATLRALTCIDHSRDEALIALTGNGTERKLIGVCRYSLNDDHSAECAVVVMDSWQGKHLGTLLMRHLIETARERRVKNLYSLDLPENYSMWDFVARLGFQREHHPQDQPLVRHVLYLADAQRKTLSPRRHG